MRPPARRTSGPRRRPRWSSSTPTWPAAARTAAPPSTTGAVPSAALRAPSASWRSTSLPVGALVVPASTHENRASELMLEHLTRQGVTDGLELVLVDRGVTAAAARTLGRHHNLEVRTRTVSVAALLVATGLALAATAARAGTPNAPKDGVNEHGETCGIVKTHGPQPDLIAVVGLDSNGQAVEGHVRSGDVWHNEPPSDPAEALKRQAGGHGRDIPVLTADGATRLGTFHVTGASKDGPTAPVPLR